MKILLVSINAKNFHKPLAPYAIAAQFFAKNGKKIDVLESNININYLDILAKICAFNADLIGFSCYIWNIEIVLKLCRILKEINQKVKIVLGGPEVCDSNKIDFVDCIVIGAGENAFLKIVNLVENNQEIPPVICENSQFEELSSPVNDFYFESFANNEIDSIENRILYYESSRGCPFSCSYCMSSLESCVQFLPLQRVKQEILCLVENKAKIVKFVDRTFNANQKRACEILSFLKDLHCNCTFHFEAAADLFSENMFRILQDMPKGRVQFEIGIQSTNQKTLQEVDRATDINLALRNIKRLSEMGNCEVCVDLIAGLPYETYQSFSKAIDECLNCTPHSLHLGFLKLLKGTKIRKESKFCKFSPFPPYEVLQTETMSMQGLAYFKKIENIIDRFYNSHLFSNTISYSANFFKSYFVFFDNLSKFIKNDNFKISTKNAFTLLYNFLINFCKAEEVAAQIRLDVKNSGQKELLPDCLKQH